MARTRRIDDVDQKILGLLNGQTHKTNQDKGYWTEKEKKRGYRYYYSHTSGDVKQVVRDLEEAYGEVYKLPTISYRLDKLVDMGEINVPGIVVGVAHTHIATLLTRFVWNVPRKRQMQSSVKSLLLTFGTC